jgi:glucose/mannose transport system permease protein
MAIRRTRLAPLVALTPAVLMTAVAFLGAIAWTLYLSFTDSRIFPNYAIGNRWSHQYERLLYDKAWAIALENVLTLSAGGVLAIALGFVIAAMVERESRRESYFRTILLYPLALSFIVTGIVWRWMFNPDLGAERLLRQLGFADATFNWLADPRTAMYGIILASIWHSLGFYTALMLAGLKSIDKELWHVARIDGVGVWRLYVEVIIPMLRWTFLTCGILLSLGVVKAYDIVVAMTNGGPGTATWTPAYFVLNAYATRGNVGYASAAAVVMLGITAVVFLPMVLTTTWQLKRHAARKT